MSTIIFVRTMTTISLSKAICVEESTLIYVSVRYTFREVNSLREYQREANPTCKRNQLKDLPVCNLRM